MNLTDNIFSEYKMPDTGLINTLLNKEVCDAGIKIIALDDDPTGVQTVHDVSVYTDWSMENIRKGFSEENPLFFILTNSRGMTEEETTKVHREIGERIRIVAEEMTKKYFIISRSDSTLRGHYPLETELLKEETEKSGNKTDGEILCFFFKEGGRFTLNNEHYVRYSHELVPASDTEFAKDATFGYKNSNLPKYVEEKTNGKYKAEDCVCISVEELRSGDLSLTTEKLMKAHDFQKIIVNAIDTCDVEAFTVSLYRALKAGKTFIARSAAALTKAMGAVSTRPLLTHEELKKERTNGGIIVVGSHTKKTTEQLDGLRELKNIEFIEMNSDLVTEGKLDEEVKRVLEIENRLIEKGVNVCVYTKRTLLVVENDTPERALKRSVEISDAVQKLVGMLEVQPSFVVAKGGITSSDVGVKALKVKRARVMGQIMPGVPVWETGEDSTFPGIPYVIFPGNVGDRDTLKEAVKKLL